MTVVNGIFDGKKTVTEQSVTSGFLVHRTLSCLIGNDRVPVYGRVSPLIENHGGFSVSLVPWFTFSLVSSLDSA